MKFSILRMTYKYLLIFIGIIALVFGSISPLIFTGDTAFAAPPKAYGDSYSTSENTTLYVSPPGVLGNDTGDNLTASLWGYTGPGTVSLNSDGSFTYTPNGGYVGTDSFTYKAFSGDQGSNAAVVTITVTAVANTPPVANSQTVTTNKNTATDITLTATDADGDPLTYSIITPPANGTLSGAPPSVTYTPNPNYVGSDSFTFKANDGTADSNTATVSITVAVTNTPPIANNQAVTTKKDTAKAITLTATDADGDPLTYYIVTPPINGTLSGTPPSVTYTPNPDYIGSDSFTFKANDSYVDSNTATVSITITATNTAPVADDQTVTTEENSAKAITLTASDDDGDPLTYSIMTNPTNGTLSGIPPSVTYTPNINYSGSDSFTFKANDGTTDSNTATVTITVIQSPPPEGDGGGGEIIQEQPGVTNISTLIDKNGLFNKNIKALSDDGQVVLKINAGTIGKTIDGKPLTEIIIKKTTHTKNLPEGINIVGAAYEFGPPGVTFNPKVIININYTPDKIQEGVSETNLVIGYYDEKAQAWISLDSVVNSVMHFVETQTEHFSLYAILSRPTTIQTTPSTTENPAVPQTELESTSALPEHVVPATFVLSDLKIMPKDIYAGESIIVSAVITNISDVAGTYRAFVTIDNVEITSRDIYLQGGASEIVTFDVGQISVGRHTIEINGTQRDIEVKATPLEISSQNTAWLYTIVGVATFLLSFSTTILVARRINIFSGNFTDPSTKPFYRQ